MTIRIHNLQKETKAYKTYNHMIEESQKRWTDRHTQSVTRRRMWHSLKSELRSKASLNHPARMKNL